MKNVKEECRYLRQNQTLMMEQLTRIEDFISKQIPSTHCALHSIENVDSEELDFKIRLPCTTVEELLKLNTNIGKSAEMQHYVVCHIVFANYLHSHKLSW